MNYISRVRSFFFLRPKSNFIDIMEQELLDKTGRNNAHNSILVLLQFTVIQQDLIKTIVMF